MDGLVTGKRGTLFKKRDSNTTFSELLQVVKNLRCSFFFCRWKFFESWGEESFKLVDGLYIFKGDIFNGKKRKERKQDRVMQRSTKGFPWFYRDFTEMNFKFELFFSFIADHEN